VYAVALRAVVLTVELPAHVRRPPKFVCPAHVQRAEAPTGARLDLCRKGRVPRHGTAGTSTRIVRARVGTVAPHRRVVAVCAVRPAREVRRQVLGHERRAAGRPAAADLVEERSEVRRRAWPVVPTAQHGDVRGAERLLDVLRAGELHRRTRAPRLRVRQPHVQRVDARAHAGVVRLVVLRDASTE
jgi:hypothetical protein